MHDPIIAAVSAYLIARARSHRAGRTEKTSLDVLRELACEWGCKRTEAEDRLCSAFRSALIQIGAEPSEAQGDARTS